MIEALLLFCMSPQVRDGDTFTCAGKGIAVRLFGVDTPERGQPGHAEATAALRGLIAGGVVCEPRGTSYNRIVALCRNAAGTDIGKAQIEGGFAVEDCRYSRGEYGGCR